MVKHTQLSLKKAQQKRTIVKVKDIEFGTGFVMIAGPCSVENEAQITEIATKVKAAGAQILRGGAFKPRTSPYDFQGLGIEGLKILKSVGAEIGLPIITEIMDTRDVELGCEYADILQIGSRNWQNFSLLKEVGKIRKPIMLKRGMNANVEEWLSSAEYVLAGGNPNVILCERGIRTFETKTRFTLDLSVIPLIHQLSHLPVIVDPSHGTGTASLIESMSLAAVAAGADGLMIEVHTNPKAALSDSDQQINPEHFQRISERVNRLQQLMSQFDKETN